MKTLFDTAESIAINKLEKAAEDLYKAGKLASKFIEWGNEIANNPIRIINIFFGGALLLFVIAIIIAIIKAR